MVFVKEIVKESLKNIYQQISNKCLEVEEVLQNYETNPQNYQDIYRIINTIHTMIYIIVQTFKDRHAHFDLYSYYSKLEKSKITKRKKEDYISDFTKGCFKTIILYINLFVNGLCYIMNKSKLKDKDYTYDYIDHVRDLWSFYINKHHNKDKVKEYINESFKTYFEVFILENESIMKDIDEIKKLLKIRINHKTTKNNDQKIKK